MALGGGRPEILVPSEASSTLFVQDLPLDCTHWEVSCILQTHGVSYIVPFRSAPPFIGYLCILQTHVALLLFFAEDIWEIKSIC